MERYLSRVQEIEEKYGVRKSKISAKLDFLQSATGLVLALFMWVHMFMVSSILFGKDAMYTVSKFFEGYYVLGESFPIIVSITAGSIFTIFFVHALIAIRKFPGGFKQYKIFRSHMKRMNHGDTDLWFYQAVTGFLLMFLGSIHLFIIMTHPAEIGPYASADRVVSEWMAPLYLLLLLAVEFHGSIGLYRLVIKWGWFDGKNPKQARKRHKKIKWFITVFFTTLGLLTLAVYVQIGLEHKGNVGERYIPTYERGLYK